MNLIDSKSAREIAALHRERFEQPEQPDELNRETAHEVVERVFAQKDEEQEAEEQKETKKNIVEKWFDQSRKHDDSETLEIGDDAAQRMEKGICLTSELSSIDGSVEREYLRNQDLHRISIDGQPIEVKLGQIIGQSLRPLLALLKEASDRLTKLENRK